MKHLIAAALLCVMSGSLYAINESIRKKNPETPSKVANKNWLCVRGDMEESPMESIYATREECYANCQGLDVVCQEKSAENWVDTSLMVD